MQTNYLEPIQSAWLSLAELHEKLQELLLYVLRYALSAKSVVAHQNDELLNALCFLVTRVAVVQSVLPFIINFIFWSFFRLFLQELLDFILRFDL